MNTCKTCRYWDRDNAAHKSICHKHYNVMSGDGSWLIAIAERECACGRSETGPVSIETGPEFGCNHWEAKPCDHS